MSRFTASLIYFAYPGETKRDVNYSAEIQKENIAADRI